MSIKHHLCVLVLALMFSLDLEAQSISEYFIPGKGWNRIQLSIPNKNGMPTAMTTEILFRYNGVYEYQDTSSNYRIQKDKFPGQQRDLNFSDGFVMSVANYFKTEKTSSSSTYFRFQDSVVLVSTVFNINYKGEDQKVDYDPEAVYLKLPKAGKTATWRYKDVLGDLHSCSSVLIKTTEKINGELQVIPTLKVTKTSPGLKGGKIIEYYQKGSGLSKIDFIDAKGLKSVLKIVTEVSSQNENENLYFGR